MYPLKKSKYGNTKVTYNGMIFDSKGERDRYFYLQEAERQGKIQSLKHQVSYDLVVNGEKICRYIADFEYYKNRVVVTSHSVGLECIVEDFKGFKTPEYKLKEKLMKAIHGITIRVVKKPTEEI
jgi:hypothetical protein